MRKKICFFCKKEVVLIIPLNVFDGSYTQGTKELIPNFVRRHICEECSKWSPDVSLEKTEQLLSYLRGEGPRCC